MIYFPGAQHTEALRNPFMCIRYQICRCTDKGEFVKLSGRQHKNHQACSFEDPEDTLATDLPSCQARQITSLCSNI